MSFYQRLFQFFYPKQRWLLGIVISCFAFGVAHSYKTGIGTRWLWQKYPFMAMILLALGFFGSMLWVKIHEQKLQENFEAKIQNQESELQQKINALTKRQQEVFWKIAEGKSNKEIASELYIEASTLKSHINQIYKNLNISNRREALQLVKRLKENATQSTK